MYDNEVPKCVRIGMIGMNGLVWEVGGDGNLTWGGRDDPKENPRDGVVLFVGINYLVLDQIGADGPVK